MSGPPWWLAYAWAASLWVAAGCAGMAGVAAVVDWVTAALGPRTDSLAPLAASQGSGDQIPARPAERRPGPRSRPATPTRTPNPHKPHQHGDPMTQPRRHLRDAATICPAHMKLSNGLVINRCELDQGHDGSHKDGCTRWGDANSARPA